MILLKTITATYLRKLGASCSEVDRFKKCYPKGLAITKRNFLLATNDGFDLGWFVKRVLLAPLLAEYERKEAPLLAEYMQERAPLWTEYEQKRVLVAYALIKAYYY